MPPLRPSTRLVLRHQAGAGVVVVVVLLLLGAPLGLLCSVLAPRADVVVAAGGPAFRNVESEAFIAADGTLFLLGIAAGAAIAVPAFLLGRRYAPGVLVGLVLGSGLAAVVSWRTGLLTEDRPAALAMLEAGAQGASFELPLQLRSLAALLGWPLGAGVVFAGLALRRADTIPGRDPTEETPDQ